MNCVLGIDTSCYTTSVALAQPDHVAASRRMLLPVPEGERGLRQSEAVFAHIKQLPDLMDELFSACPETRVTGVCVSAAPCDGEDSYMPVFRAGVSTARSVAAALRVPLWTTTHQRGHVRAALAETGLTPGPLLAVHLSGGTTDVLQVAEGRIVKLGSSLDLHAGQLVDRIGVRLGLPFPCGSHLEKLAVQGTAQGLLPVSMAGVDCHLSGAETRLLQELARGLSPEDGAAEVYHLLCRTVLSMLDAAREKTGVSRVLLAGGVASSSLFRQMLLQRCRQRKMGLQLFFGKPEYSGDNACGVALIGAEKQMGGTGGWQL